MSRYLHRISAILFYLLGASYFVGYLLHRNAMAGPWPLWWMSVADLPLALVALAYGGTSLYLSTKKTDQPQKGKAMLIALPLFLVFILLFLLNYWQILGLPTAEF